MIAEEIVVSRKSSGYNICRTYNDSNSILTVIVTFVAAVGTVPVVVLS